MVNSTSNIEIPPWLRRLPLAPEFHPTDTEFADPIAYISRIEKEASAFGICKIIPPLPKPSKKYVFSNLNKSLVKCPDFYSDIDMPNLSNMPKNGSCGNGDDGEARAVFTTRQQELGQSVRKTKGVGSSDNPLLAVHKQVWQSGEVYTLEQFESKSKTFAKSVLGKEASPLVVEALFWNAASAKPIYIEYANDVPGSGFGEPEGQFRYYRRRRRKMKSWKSFRNRGKSECEHDDVGSVKNFRNDETRDASVKNDPSISSETPNSSTASSTIHVDDNQGSNNARMRRKSVNCSNDVEGTAGWKLSNSPWNLQVISRSPGSLTRFMPDDIPGVTSPMVYIGMLFSWFAWHVEDHELHSMNFLHTGASKTWYAVPGDYAFTFEETIRSKAYGGNIDRLAALTLLGEKTTLLSPEVIVASGIPCCRLIQYPGEFVVTFPRAYHVGFSHAFFLLHFPMLSHQQLLYLLTMSFVSRVPRSLLPGARSSRLRGRQKEERELLVKKAFVEDILKENHTLSVLLGLNETINAVLWNPDILPCANKESQLPILTDTTTPAESGSHTCSKENNKESNLVDEMSLYMETLKAMDLEDDDVSSDFQIDSGPLACVACGILGFPFMSVVQLSERASMELELIDQSAGGEARGVPEHKDLNTFTQTDGSIQSSVSADVVPVLSKDSVIPSATKLSKKWNTCSKYLKPRIFCLEHAVQIEELLRSKGGANILVICHSDFQKIRANAAAVAEEIHTPFDLKNVSLGNASEEDLHLIDLAIDDGEHDQFTEDWTSKLGINLQYCVKVRKNAPSKRVHHALSLGDLFSDTSLNFSEIRWQARKSRSKVRLNHPVNSRPRQSIERKAEEVLVETSTAISSEKGKKVIQYTRRKFKLKSNFSVGASSSGTCNNLDQHSLNHVPSRVAESPPTATLAVDSVGPNERRTLEDTDSKCEEQTVMDADVNREKSETCAERCHGDQVMAADDNLETCGLDQAMENENIMKENGVCDHVTSGNEVRQDMVVCSRTSEHDENEEEGLYNDNNMNQPSEVFAAEDFCNDAVQKGTDENPVLSSFRVTVQPDSSTKSESKEEFVSSSVTRMEVEFSSSRLAEGCSKEEESCADDVALDLEARSKSQTTSETNVDVPVSSSSLRMEERRSTSEVPRGMFAEENLSNDVAVDDELQENEETAVATNEDSEPGSLPPINHHYPVKGKKYSPKDSKISAGSNSTKGTKRKREVERKSENEFNFSEFIRSPCEGLRPRSGKIAVDTSTNDISRKPKEKISATKTVKKPLKDSVPSQNKKKIVKEYDHKCDLDGCHMSFKTKKELSLHKRNQCPVEGCGKKFSSHKYAIIHQRVHDDDRPLKCPWEGCHMSFKWAWARTEHIRVHTGERPYKCKVEGCGLSFRFVSDISRHRRKTGHYEK